MTRILTFVPLPRSSKGSGGTEEYAYSLIDELRKQHFDVSVITSHLNGLEPKGSSNNREDNSTTATTATSAAAYIDSSLFLLRPIPKVSSILVLPKITKLVKQSDIVHIHMPYPFVEAYISLLATLMGKRIVVTYHMDARLDSNTETDKSRPRRRNRIIEKLYYLGSSRYPLERASVICSNTRAYAEQSPILKKFISKVHVIYQGISEQLFGQIDGKRVNLLRSDLLQNRYEFIVSFVGRLVPYKGLPYLLEAVRIINETSNSNDLKIHFVIGGTGRERQRLAGLSKKLGLTNVSFIGYVDDKDLFNLYRASDMVVSPSISPLESTPISLLSALSSGTPVIGTFIGGTEETIPNDGRRAVIVVPKSASELALAIRKLLDKNKHTATSEKKPLINIRFWSDVAADYGELFSKIITKGSVISDGQIAFR